MEGDVDSPDAPGGDKAAETPETLADIESADKAGALAQPYVAPPDRSDIPIEYKLLLILPLVMLGKFIVPVVQRWIAAVAFPYQLDGEEGFIAVQALTMYLKDSIYQPIANEPYLVGNYPPLVPWIISLFMRPESIGMGVGRLVVIESAIWCVLMIALLTGLRTRRLVCAAMGAVLFVATYEFHQWSAFCRVDFPALALTLAGLCVFANGRTTYATAASALIFVAAGYARQTALLAPMACMIGLTIHDRKRLLWFVIPYLGLGAGVFVLLNALTGGEFFRHTIAYNRNVMDWGAWRAVMQNEIGYFYLRWILALIAGATLCAMARLEQDAPAESGAGRFRELAHARSAIGIYALLATLSLTWFAKVGSAPNYALEPLAAWAVFGTETLGRLFDLAGGATCTRRRWARAGAGVMTALLLLHGLYLGTAKTLRNHDVGADLVSSPTPNDIDRQVGMAVLAEAQATEGQVWSEMPIFTLLAGRDVMFQPFILSQLAKEGKWDERKFARMLDENNVQLIVTAQDLRLAGQAPIMRLTLGMVADILQRYEIHAAIHGGDGASFGQTYYLWKRIKSPQPTKEDEEELKQISAM